MPRKVEVEFKFIGGDLTAEQFNKLSESTQRALQRIKDAATPVSPALQGINAAANELGTGVQNLVGRLGPLGNVLTSLGTAGLAAGAIGALGAGIFVATKNAVAFGDALADTSKQVNINVESLQALQLAGAQQGLSQERVNQSLTMFAANVGKAKEGTGPLVALLKNYNVELLENIRNSTSQDQALRLVADAISKEKDAAVQAAIAQAAFSRGGAAWVPVLRDGARGLDELTAKMKEFGFVITAEMIHKADVAQDHMQFLATGLHTKFMAALLENQDEVVKLSLALTQLAINALDALTKISQIPKKLALETEFSGPGETFTGVAEKAAKARLADIQDTLTALKALGGAQTDIRKQTVENLEAEKAHIQDLLGIQTQVNTSVAEEEKQRRGAYNAATLEKAAARELASDQKKLAEITAQANLEGLSAIDKIIAKRNEEIAVVEAMSKKFPQLASQAASTEVAIWDGAERQITEIKTQEQAKRDALDQKVQGIFAANEAKLTEIGASEEDKRFAQFQEGKRKQIAEIEASYAAQIELARKKGEDLTALQEAETAAVQHAAEQQDAIWAKSLQHQHEVFISLKQETIGLIGDLTQAFEQGGISWKNALAVFKTDGTKLLNDIFLKTLENKAGFDDKWKVNFLTDLPGLVQHGAGAIAGIFDGLFSAIMGKKEAFVGDFVQNLLGGGSGGGGSVGSTAINALAGSLGSSATNAFASALSSAAVSAAQNAGSYTFSVVPAGTSYITGQQVNGGINAPAGWSNSGWANTGYGFVGGLGGGFLGSYLGQQLGGGTGGKIGGIAGGLGGQYLATTYGPQIAQYLASQFATATPAVVGAATTAVSTGAAAGGAAAAANAVNIVPGIGTAIALLIHAGFTAYDVAKGHQSLMGAQINESVDPLGLLGMLGVDPAKILGQGLGKDQVARRGLSGLLQGTNAFGDLPKLTASARDLVGEFKNGNSIFERTDELLKQYPKLSGDALGAGMAFALGVGGAVKTPLNSSFLAGSATFSDLIARLGQGGTSGKDAIAKIQHATVELGITSTVQLNAITKLLDKGKISAEQFAKAMKGIDTIGVDQGTDKGEANKVDLRAKQVAAIQLEFARGKVTFEEYIKLLNEIETTAVNTFDGVGIAVETNLGKLETKTGVSATAIHTVFDVLQKDGITSLDAFGSASSETLAQLEKDLGGAGSEGERIFQALAQAGILNFTDMANLSKPQIQAIINALNLIPKEIVTHHRTVEDGEPVTRPQGEGNTHPTLPPGYHPLAAGFHGVVDRPTHFLIGEAGPELLHVTPMRDVRRPASTTASSDAASDPEIKMLLRELIAVARTPKLAFSMSDADFARLQASAKRTGYIR